MCGICGILSPGVSDSLERLRAMNHAQAHRGPDGEGLFCEDEIALGHRRLAILDPEGGAQPMHSACGRHVLIYNGEIYNFAEHRRRLEAGGCHFRTRTDTEVLLHLYAEAPDQPQRWLSALNGIYAFALWDRERHRLLLARDPIGVKPLHLAQHQGALLFGSEIKSLLAAGLPARLHTPALHAFLNIRFVPGEETLFQGVHRLAPGHFQFAEPGRLHPPVSFHHLPDTLDDRGSLEVYAEEVGQRFSCAVERQLLSDVPIGMALSGGLDSSMIVHAAAQALASGRDLRTADRVLRTFTLGFNEPTDENEDARRVALRYGTEHHDTKLRSDPLASLATVIRAVEEPKVNMQQGYALAAFVRPHVPVLFGGLGGDELFAGYDIHRFCNTLGRFHRPGRVLRPLGASLSALLWQLQTRSGVLRTEHYRIGAQIALSLGDKAQFYTRLRNAWDEDGGMYHRLYLQPERFLDLPRTKSYFEADFQNELPFLDQVLRCEFRNKMVNDFLVNEDRVTSAHGLEGRVPFLDHELVDFAFRIPAAYKMRGRETKVLWKAAAAHVLPEEILRKKKQGFTFSSYHQWQKDLRDTVARELTPEWCRDAGLFNPAFVQSLLSASPAPTLRWHYFLAWKILGVKAWIQQFNVAL